MPTTPRLLFPFPEDDDTADVPRDMEALADRIEALTAWIRQADFAADAGVFLPGDLKVSACADPQTGFLLCDGASKLRADFADLFTALGGAASPYGLPDGTHFNVPDLRGRSLVGAGAGSGLTARALAARFGEETHLLTVPEMPSHTHNIQTSGPPPSATIPAVIGQFAPGGGLLLTNAIVATGGDGAHNNVQPSVAVNVFVKT